MCIRCTRNAWEPEATVIALRSAPKFEGAWPPQSREGRASDPLFQGEARGTVLTTSLVGGGGTAQPRDGASPAEPPRSDRRAV